MKNRSKNYKYYYKNDNGDIIYTNDMSNKGMRAIFDNPHYEKKLDTFINSENLKLLNRINLSEFMWWSDWNGQTTAYINIFEKGVVSFEYNNFKHGISDKETIIFKTYEELKNHVDSVYIDEIQRRRKEVK